MILLFRLLHICTWILLSTVFEAASPQVMEFSGFLMDPSAGPYNQSVKMKVQVIRRFWPDQLEALGLEEKDAEAVVWNKTYDDVFIHNGTFNFLMDEDDDGKKISSATEEGGVFQNSIEYSFDGEERKDLLSRAIYPDATYAIRIFFRLSDLEKWEQIKPDFNIDGSPRSLSSVDITGFDTKVGNLTLDAMSDEPKDTGSVLEIDTMEGQRIGASYLSLSKNHGLYLENGSITIEMDQGSNNYAFDIAGAMYLRDSQMLLEGNTTLNEGDIQFNSLCMASDCKVANPVFTGNLYSYRSVRFQTFEDSDDPKIETGLYRGTRYVLNPAGKTTFSSLNVTNQTTNQFPYTLRFQGGSSLILKGKTELSLQGGDVRLRLPDGKISMEMNISKDGTLSHDGIDGGKLDLRKFRIQSDTGDIADNARIYYKNPDFFKLSAGQMNGLEVADASDTNTPSYYVKPSKISNFKALQFHFENKEEARLEINRTIKDPNRQVNVVFDPILTQETVEALIGGGELMKFHQHDLISQAKTKELLGIINSPKFQDNTYIDFEHLDSSLAKLPVSNRFEDYMFFSGSSLYFESSFLSKGEIIAAYGPDNEDEATSNRLQISLGGSPEKNLAWIATYNPSVKQIELRNPSDYLDTMAGSLFLESTLQATIATDKYMIVGGEFTSTGKMNISGNLYAKGIPLFGCVQAAHLCPPNSEVKANEVTNAYSISAGSFYDREDPSYYLDPDKHSRLKRLTVTDLLSLQQPSNTIEGDLKVSLDFSSKNAIIGSTNAQVSATSYLTHDELYYSDPAGISRWNSLHVTDTLDLQGDLNVQGEIFIGGSLKTNSLSVMQNSTVHNEITASRFEDLDSFDGSVYTKYVDPHDLSNLNHLTVDSDLYMAGTPVFSANLTLAKTLTIFGNLTNTGQLLTPRFEDLDNLAYFADPTSLSNFNVLNINSNAESEIMTLRSVSIAKNLDVNGKALFSGMLTVDKDTLVKSEISLLSPTGLEVFRITNQGDIYARSATFTESVTIDQTGDIAQNLTVARSGFFYSPTYMNELNLSVAEMFSLENSSGTSLIVIDSLGNLSSVTGSTRISGEIRFLLSTIKGRLRSDAFELGSDNPSVREMIFKRADSTYLDIHARNLTATTTQAGSSHLIAASQAILEEFIDANDSRYSSRPNAMTTLNSLEVLSAVPVQIPSMPVKIPRFSDLDNPFYLIDPSSMSRLHNLSVDNLAFFQNGLKINSLSGGDSFTTRVLIRTSLSLGNPVVLDIDGDLSVDRLGNLSSTLDFTHFGKIELTNSTLSLGIGSSTVSVNQQTMTTLIYLPPLSYIPSYQTSFPVYFADHLHTHDKISGIDSENFALKSQTNIFTGPTRFRYPGTQLTLEPTSSVNPSWSSSSSNSINRHFPFVGIRDEDFILIGGYSDENRTLPIDSILNWNSNTNLFSSLTSHSSLGNQRALVHHDSLQNKTLVAGGIDSGNLQNQLFVWNGAWNGFALPLPIAYGQMITHNQNLYLFGGFTQSASMIYPTTFTIHGTPSSLSWSPSTLPAHTSQNLGAYLYVKGNSLYRSYLDFSSEKLIYTHTHPIRAPMVSSQGFEICFHDSENQLFLYNLVTQNQLFLSQGHHCQFGQGNETDWIYFVNSNSDYGQLARIRRNGSDKTNILVASGFETRDFYISSDASVSVVARTTLNNLSGEWVLQKEANSSFSRLKSDQTSKTLNFFDSGFDFYDLQVKNGLITALSANTHNLRPNLFLSDQNLSESMRQISYFPQGIDQKPVIFNSQQALVAVSAWFEETNKLPVNYKGHCSATYQNEVYLFGAGAQILVYELKKDEFRLHSEPMPFTTTFACTFDQQQTVYFQNQQKFWKFDFSTQRFWELADILMMGTDTTGALAFTPANNSVYFLKYETSTNSAFLSYNPSTDIWQNQIGPGLAYDGTTLQGIGAEVYLFGNKNGVFNRKFNAGVWTDLSGFPSNIDVDESKLFSVHSLPIASSILIFGGTDSTNFTTSIWLYSTVSDHYTTLPDLRVAIENAGSFQDSSLNQLYIFGGTNSQKTLQIYPLNAQNSNNFEQIYRIDLASGEKTFETSKTRFALGVVNHDDTLIAYSPSHYGLNIYNVATKTDIDTPYAGFKGVAEVSGLALDSDSTLVYYSVVNPGHETIYRYHLTTHDTQNVSTTFLQNQEGRVQFISKDDERIFFLNGVNAKIGWLSLNNSVIDFTSPVSELVFFEPASIQARKDGVLLVFDSTNFIPTSTKVFEDLTLQEITRSPSGDFYFSAKKNDTTTDLYFLAKDQDTPQNLTNLSAGTMVENPHWNSFTDRLVFTKNFSGVPNPFELNNFSSLQINGDNDKNHLISTTILEHGLDRNLSFIYQNRIYTLLTETGQGTTQTHGKIYRTQVLGTSAVPLNWNLYDANLPIFHNRWQILQKKDLVIFYDEDTKKIYQYLPEEKALRLESTIITTITSGVLAMSKTTEVESQAQRIAFHLIGNGSIASTSTLSEPDSEISLEVYSSADTSAMTNPQRLFSISKSGHVFARQMVGAADLTDNTLRGGPGNQGIHDGSLVSSDLQNFAITNAKIMNQSFNSTHFQSHTLSAAKLQNSAIEGSHLKDSVITSAKLSDFQITSDLLGFSTLSHDKFQTGTLKNEDFSDASIQTEHIQNSSITSDVIADNTLDSLVFADNTLVLEDIKASSLGSKQVPDLGILNQDLSPLTFLNHHFQTNSVHTQNLKDNSIQTQHIVSRTIGAEKILDFSIANEDLSPLTITGSLMKTGILTSGNISDHASGIANENLAPNSITHEKMATDSLDGSKFDTSVITSVKLDFLTLTNREFGPDSIDTNKIADNSIHNELLKSDAITIDKISPLAFDTIDFNNGIIEDRHLFSGGQGALTSFNTTMNFQGRENPALCFYENYLYLVGGNVAGATRINLLTKTTEEVPALAVLPANISAHAHTQTTLYLFANSLLQSVNLDSLEISTLSTEVFEGSNDYGGGAVITGNQFYLIGGAGPHANFVHSCDLSTGIWTTKTLALPEPLRGSEVVHHNGIFYAFGNDTLLTSNDAITWGSANLGTGVNFLGSRAIVYENKIYIFGGNANPSAITVYTPSVSIARLQDQPLNIGFDAEPNQVIEVQNRFYIPFTQGEFANVLFIWHPHLDASISDFHLDDNAVAAKNIATASLSSLNFSTDSIDSDKIRDFEIQNEDIKNNVLTDHSIANLIFTSAYFTNHSITHTELKSFEIDSRTILDFSLQDSDFDTDSIDSRTLSTGSIWQKSIAAKAISTGKIANFAITLSKLKAQSVTGEDLLDEQITNEKILDFSIDGRVLASQTLLSTHIIDLSIQTRHFASNSILLEKISTHTLTDRIFASQTFIHTTMVQDFSIFDTHIATKAITLSKFSSAPSDRLTNSKFQTGAVASVDVQDHTIIESNFASDSVTRQHIIDFSLKKGSFAPLAILTHHFAPISLEDHHFATNTIATTAIADLTLTAAQFATGSFGTQHFSSFTLETENFKDNSIGAIIEQNSITSEKIINQSLLSEDFSVNSITSHAFSFASILNDHIKTSVIAAIKLSDSILTTRKIKPASISEDRISSGAIHGDQIADSAIFANLLLDDSLPAHLFETASISGIYIESATIETDKLQDDFLDDRILAKWQIDTTHIKDSAIQTAHLALDSVTKMKLESLNVFGSENILDRSIRGESIVSFSLGSSDLASNAIRRDLIQNRVIMQYPALDDSTAEQEATTTILTDPVIDIQRLEDGWYIATNASVQSIQKTTDLLFYEEVFSGVCDGDDIHAFSFLDQKRGYIACSDQDLFYIDAKGARWVSTLPEPVRKMHFFDSKEAVILCTDGTQSSVFYSSDGGINWTRTLGPKNNLSAWSILNDQIALSDIQDGTNGSLFISQNHAQSFSTKVYSPAPGDHTKVFPPAFDPLDGKLYAIVETNDGQKRLSRLDFSGANLAASDLTPPAMLGSLNAADPLASPAISSRSLYLFTTHANFGVFRLDLDELTLSQLYPPFAMTDQNTMHTPGYQEAPFVMDQNRILARTANMTHILWQPESWDHIKDHSLLSRSIGNSAIRTEHVIPASLTGDYLKNQAIEAVDIKPGGFDFGDFLIETHSNSKVKSLQSLETGNRLLAINATSILLSEDFGKSFTAKASFSDSSIPSFLKVNSRFILCASSTNRVLFSTDSATSFSEILTSPLQSTGAGFIFDENNILLIGTLANKIQMANYNPELKSFILVKNTSASELFLASDPIDVSAWDLHFLDANTGYASLTRQTQDSLFLKTSNHGQSWSEVVATTTAQAPVFQIISSELMWLGAGTRVSRIENSAIVSSYDFTTLGEAGPITALYVMEKTALVACGEKIYLSTDQAGSFSRLKTLSASVDSIQPLSSDLFLLSGILLDMQIASPRERNFLLTALKTENFKENEKIKAFQIRDFSLKNEDLADGIFNSSHFENETLKESQIQNSAITGSHISSYSLEAVVFEDESFTYSKFTTYGITGSQFKSGVITSGHIIDGTIGSREIATGVIDSASIAAGAIKTSFLKDGDFTGRVLADRQILTTHLIELSFYGSEFQTATFSGINFVDQSVKRQHLLQSNFNLPQEKLMEDTLTQASLLPSQISSRLIMDQSIYGWMIQNLSLDQSHLKSAVISQDQWMDAMITTDIINSKILDSRTVLDFSVAGFHFKNSSLGRDQYSNDSIPASKIISFSLTGREFATGAVLSSHLSTDPLDLFSASHFQSAIVSAGNLKGGFSEQKFADLAFTADKFFNRAFTQSKMKTNILTASHFGTKTLTHSDFANASILQENLALQSFTAKLKDQSVSSEHIISFVLTGEQIAPGSLNSEKFSPQSVFAYQLGTLHESQVADHAIGSSAIQKRVIDSSVIRSLAISGTHFMTNTLISSKLADQFLVLEDLQNSDITTGYIRDLSLKNEDFADESFTNAKLIDNNLQGSRFQDGFLSSALLSDGTITANKIKNQSIDSRVLTSFVISSANIKNLSLQDSSFTLQSLTDSDFLTASLTHELITSHSIENQSIVSFTLTDSKFQNQTIAHSHIKSNSLTAGLFSSGILQDRIQDSQITAIKISNTVKIPKNRFISGSISKEKINTGAIIGTHLINNSLTSDKFTGITGDKIATREIDISDIVITDFNTTWIQDHSITEQSIANLSLLDLHFETDSLDELNFESATIPLNKIADGAISRPALRLATLIADNFQNDSLQDQDLVSYTLEIDRLDLGSLQGSDVELASLSWVDLQDLALQSVHIENSLIQTTNIMDSQVNLAWVTKGIESRHIQNGQLKSTNFTDSIPGSKFVSYIISGSKFASSEIEASKFAQNIPYLKIAKDTLTLSDFDTGSTLFTDDTKIKDGTINSDDFAQGVIDGSKVKAKTLVASDFSQTLTDGKIPDQGVGSEKIAISAVNGRVLFQSSVPTDSRLLNGLHLSTDMITGANVRDGDLKKQHLDTEDLHLQTHFNFGGTDTKTHADGFHFHPIPTTSNCPAEWSSSGGFCINNSPLDEQAVDSPHTCARESSSGAQAHVCNYQELLTACKKSPSIFGDGKNYITSTHVSGKMIGFTYQSSSGCDFAQNSIFIPWGTTIKYLTHCCLSQ